MYRILKPLLFVLPPEAAHVLVTTMLDLAACIAPGRKVLRWFYGVEPGLEVCKAGLAFPNPIGLAAGFDKDGRHISSLACLGFGFIEVGTVTPRPQPGNPQPRLFRLPSDQALINRMGFNNEGVDALVERLRQIRLQPDLLQGVLLGGNIGKNKDTPNEQADADYLLCLERLHPWVDYFVVNVSSPNTPGLRALQEKAPLERLLTRLQEKNRQLGPERPMLLKIAPDLSDEQLDDVADIVRQTGLAGIVASNTTVRREGLRADTALLELMGSGGLSGAPLREQSTRIVRLMRQKLGPDALIIGVGGIDSRDAAREKIEAGADVVQVYTGLVYRGPGLARMIANGA